MLVPKYVPQKQSSWSCELDGCSWYLSAQFPNRVLGTLAPRWGEAQKNREVTGALNKANRRDKRAIKDETRM